MKYNCLHSLAIGAEMACPKCYDNARQERDSLQREVYRYKKALESIAGANPDDGLFMHETAKEVLEGE